MKRWRRKLASMLLAIGAVSPGCKQPLYMTENDHQEMLRLGMPRDLEHDPNAAALATTLGNHPKPPSILDPDRPVRYLSLPEAISLGLEQGNISSGAANGQGGTGGLGNAGAGGGFAGDDAIRAFALDPAIAGASIESALSKFDARWTSSMQWQKTDQGAINVFSTFQNNQDTAAFSSSLVKPLPTGGTAGVTFATNYTRFNAPPAAFGGGLVNPNYAPALTFQFEQPLLQNYGVDINQLLATHPGTVFIPNNRGQAVSQGGGILITRLRYEQSKYEFERQVNNMVLNIEQGYWALYAAYWNLYAAEVGLRLSFESYRTTGITTGVGKTTLQDKLRAQNQFEEFRATRITSLQNVLSAERDLRALLGMPVDDGQRLVPSDAPTLTPYVPDWNASIADMQNNRPELHQARIELKARQFDLIVQKNNLRPDLRAFSSYGLSGLGTRLDGSDDPNQLRGNALANLSTNRFQNWTMGVQMNVTLGTRDAHAQTRISRLNLARTYTTLKSQELKAERFLAATYQDLDRFYELIRTQKGRRELLSELINLEKVLVVNGKKNGAEVEVLEAQRNFAQALAAEHQAIADYNSSISRFQYAKGTILSYNNVVIADGQLTPLALERAVDHYQQRSLGLIARERPTLPSADGNAVPLPSLNPVDPLPAMTDKPAEAMPLIPGGAPLPDAASLKLDPQRMPGGVSGSASATVTPSIDLSKPLGTTGSAITNPGATGTVPVIPTSKPILGGTSSPLQNPLPSLLPPNSSSLPGLRNNN
jgi:outer membrane protein TolC